MTGSQAALRNAFTRQAQLGNHFRSPVQLGNEWKNPVHGKKKGGAMPTLFAIR